MMMQLSLVGPPEPPIRSGHPERLRRKILAALASTLAAHDVDPRVLNDATDAVVAELSPKPAIGDRKATILRMCDQKPVCWICSLPISLAETGDAPGAFSLDHVVPRSAGGGRLGFANVKPAHRFCNLVRGQKQMRPKTRARYEAFLASLQQR